MATAAFIENETEFNTLLTTESVLVVDCTATWCGPCRLIAPLIDRLAEEYNGQATVMKLDLDRNKDVARQYGIKSIPAVMFFKQGELMETLVGKKPYEEFETTLKQYLGI